MKGSRYQTLKRDIIIITLIVSLAPLIVLGGMIYYQFSKVYKEKIEDQLKNLTRSQMNAVEVFLRERASILSTIADTHSFADLKQQDHLSHYFEAINQRADGLGLVDLGVIDGNGQHLTYVGPYDLKGLNYFQEPWFSEVMSKGKYISDVYLGFRKLPHFIIAVRGHDESGVWILRATIDSDVFNRLVRTAHAGKSGDAYIINKKGAYQTLPRFTGEILGLSGLDPKNFGEDITVIEKSADNGQQLYYAGAWLKNNDWLLVISREVGTEAGGLVAARNVEIFLIIFGCFAIIVMTVITTNITVRRLEEADRSMNELNAQLMQSDKMAALGKMAAGIAHEINNPLAIIGEKAGWMRDLLADEKFQESDNFKEYEKSIDKIEDQVERARKITHNMLGFARRMEPRLDDVDVNEVLKQTIDLLGNHARINNIVIRTDFQSDIAVIASDQSQLQQVFLNLINNAIDAIGKDGMIEIVTRSAGVQIEVDIKDNGPGIPPELKRKVFDPFYTTKVTGKGTGLGLSISYSIIEKMGGTITLSSKESQGTTFTVKLPVKIPEKK